MIAAGYGPEPPAPSRFTLRLSLTFINLGIKDGCANPAIDKAFGYGNLPSPLFTSPQTQSLLLAAAVHSPADEKFGPS